MKSCANHGLNVLCSYLVREGVGLGINLPTLLRTYAELEGLDPDELLKDHKLYHRCYKRVKRFIDRLRRKTSLKLRRLMDSFGSSPRLT